VFYFQFMKLAYRFCDDKKLLLEQHAMTSKMVEYSLEIFGATSDEYTDSLYLQSKVKFSLGEGLQAYDLIKKACKIESSKPQTHTRKDL